MQDILCFAKAGLPHARTRRPNVRPRRLHPWPFRALVPKTRTPDAHACVVRVQAERNRLPLLLQGKWQRWMRDHNDGHYANHHHDDRPDHPHSPHHHDHDFLHLDHDEHHHEHSGADHHNNHDNLHHDHPGADHHDHADHDHHDAHVRNDTLLPMASHAEQYYNPPGNHPSEPNYLWLEAGTNFGIRDDNSPASNHQRTTRHLVSLLNAAGVSWKAYQEDISGTTCPLTNRGSYAVKHNPFVFFDDVTGSNNPADAYCIAHVRPYSELATDLSNNTVARYNFITPNVCNDMHNSCAPLHDKVKQGDAWLSTEVPRILASRPYAANGVLFITWDEAKTGDGPIGMIVLSPVAKGGGYSNRVQYTHSSTLRTLEEIFGVSPLLGGAASATDLRDLFVSFP